MVRPALTSLLLVAGFPVLAAAQAEGAGEAETTLDSLDVLGVVVDAETREPIEGVAVRLRLKLQDSDSLGRADVTLTDRRGRFFFRDLGEGRYRIELERLGYGTLVDSIAYRPILGLRIEAELVPEAVELEPILVAVEARSRHLQASGFYDRQERGIGRFITREEIEERMPSRVTDLLVMVPSVRLERRRHVGGSTVVRMRRGCVADVYVDGVKTIQPFKLDETLHPNDVAAIEIYHAVELPAQYGQSECGALLVWTRLPEAGELGNPFTWGRVVGGLVFILGAMFLTR